MTEPDETTDYVKETEESLALLGVDKNQPHAIIEPRRTVIGVDEQGLTEIEVWGWVKLSAKFISQIRALSGANLKCWLTISLAIDESGKCKLTVKQLCALTGLSHTEVIDSTSELEEKFGLLSVKRSKRGNEYSPIFVARGAGNDPSEVKKVDFPERSKESLVNPSLLEKSTPPLETPSPSIKELKELNTAFIRGDTPKPDLVAQWLMLANAPGIKKSAQIDAILSALGEAFTINTETKRWKEFAEFCWNMKKKNKWEVGDFILWLKRQDNFDITFWSPQRMTEYYPQAFVKKKDETKQPVIVRAQERQGTTFTEAKAKGLI